MTEVDVSKMVSLRLPEDLAEWADEYAKQRGVSRSDLLIEGLASFREDCQSGVPEIRAAIARQSSVNPRGLAALQGVGNCPDRPGELGHVWKSPQEDPERACTYCGLRGRLSRPIGVEVVEHPNYLSQATAERAEVFSNVEAPMQSGTGKPRDLTPQQQARVEAILADKRRRDAEAVKNGTARPGQIAGARGKKP
jgi:hypothetical protein